MALKTRAKSAKAGAKDANPKQTIEPKLYISTRENDFKNTKRCCLCSAAVRSEDTKTALQDTTNAAANISAEPVDSIQPAESRELARVPSAAVQLEWNSKRRRSGVPTKDVEDFFRSRWASMSVDELVAATTLVQLKNDPNYFAPVQKKSRQGETSCTR